MSIFFMSLRRYVKVRRVTKNVRKLHTKRVGLNIHIHA